MFIIETQGGRDEKSTNSWNCAVPGACSFDESVCSSLSEYRTQCHTGKYGGWSGAGKKISC